MPIDDPLDTKKLL